jgi:hypothetical protein
MIPDLLPNAQEPVLRGLLNTSFSKILAVGCLKEVKAILVWIIDTRRLLLSLPAGKCEEWSAEILTEIAFKLRNTVGSLNHELRVPTSIRTR